MAIKTSLEMVTNHWCQTISGISVTPSQLYETMARAIEEQKIPEVEFSRVWWKENAFIGPEREYLRVVRRRYVYDFCAAPYGKGFFFSSWLCIVPFTISAWHLAGMLVSMLFFVRVLPLGIYLFLSLILSGTLWWMHSRTQVTTSPKDDFVLGLTGLGPFLRMKAEARPTYYQIDTAGVFQAAVQEAVLSVLDGLCKEQNLRLLDDLERKPVAREFLKK